MTAPLTISADVVRLRNSYAENLRKLSDIAEACERGQGETPISQAIQDITAVSDDRPHRVALLALDGRARECCTRYLVKLVDLNSASFSNTTGTVAVHIGPRSNGVKSLAEQEGIPSFYLATLEVTRNIDLLIARDINQLQDDAFVYQAFCTHGQLLVLAYSEPINDSKLSADIRSLTSSFAVVCPIALGQQLPLPPELRGHPACGPVTVNSSLSFSLPQLSGSLGHLLDLFDRVRNIRAVMDRIEERQTRDLRRLQQRKAAATEHLDTNNSRGKRDEGREASNVRNAVTDRVHELEMEILTSNERAIQPLGELSAFFRGIVNELKLADLEEEVTPSTIELRLNSAHLKSVNQRISRALQDKLSKDLQVLLDSESSIRAEAISKMKAIFGADLNLPAEPLIYERVWGSMENLILIGEESEIELPRKGVMELLMAGRQKIFIILMFLMMLSRFGLDIKKIEDFLGGWATFVKNGCLIAVGILFVTTIVQHLQIRRHEKKTRSRREFSRMQDALLSSGNRVIEQAQKAKLTSIREHLKDFLRKSERAIEEFSREGQERSRAEAENRESKAEKQLSVIESQLKGLTESGRDFARVKQSISDLETQIRSSLAGESRVMTISAISGATEPVEIPVTEPAKQDIGSSEFSGEPGKLISGLALRRAALSQPGSATPRENP